MGLGQPQAGPLSLGGKERAEDLVTNFQRHARAGILHRQKHMVSGHRSGHKQLSPVCHCLQGVLHQIDQALLDHVRVGVNFCQGLIQAHMRLHPLIAARQAHDVHGRRHQTIQVNLGHLRLCRAGEIHETLEDLVQPLGFVKDDGQLFARLLVKPLGPNERIGKAADSEQRIANLMGHVGGKLSDGSQLFRLLQPIFN